MSQAGPVFVDLDSTLANTLHRGHLIDAEDYKATDWDAYALACTDDEVFEGVAVVVRALFGTHTIVIVSGRSDVSADLTRAWLQANNIPYDDMLLRVAGGEDVRSNEEYKAARMRDWLFAHKQAAPALVIDDWPLLIPEMEKLGWPLLLVNPNYPLPPSVHSAVNTVAELIENVHADDCRALQDEVFMFPEKCNCNSKPLRDAFDVVSTYLYRFDQGGQP